MLRGVWVLKKLLGHDVPPPPADVPAVEPDIRGATTLREQLNKHRDSQSCAVCHRTIDPPGFAMEEFNPLGGYRDWYRSLGENGERVAKYNYRKGPGVEKGDAWPDGRAFADFREFRSQLLEDSDQLARAMAEKLLVYGTGRPVTNAETAAVEAVVEAARRDELGFRSMIHAVVESELFYRP